MPGLPTPDPLLPLGPRPVGKTDASAPKHQQQTMVLVPMDAPGVRVLRPLTVFGATLCIRSPFTHARRGMTLSCWCGGQGTTTRPSGTRRWPSMASACRAATCCSGKAAASRSRRGGWGPVASTTACGHWGWESGHWRRWRRAHATASPSGARSFVTLQWPESLPTPACSWTRRGCWCWRQRGASTPWAARARARRSP